MNVIGSAISRKGTCLFSRWQVRLSFLDLVNVKVTAMQYLLHLGVRYDKDKRGCVKTQWRKFVAYILSLPQIIKAVFKLIIME